MKIALGVLTCDRYDYTVRTVESFLEFNQPEDFLLFHADDASTDERIVPYMQANGFKTIIQNTTRVGCSPITDAVVQEVAKLTDPGTLFLYLQNDLESVRPLPIDQVRDLLVRPEITFVQLSYRSAAQKYTKHIKWMSEANRGGEEWVFGETKHPVVYAGFKRGMGFQPSIAPIETWKPAASRNKKEREFRAKTEFRDREMCRLTLPVFRHIGKWRTPDGKFGRKRANQHSRVGRARYDQSRINRSGWQAGASVCKKLCEIIQPGMKTLELGSGLTTYLFMALGCKHTALENDAEFAPNLSCVKICSMVGDPAWYDWQPDGPYDLILVDGPHRQRRGILNVLDQLVHDKTILIFDDTHRRHDRQVCRRIARRLGRQRVNIPAVYPEDFGKSATIIGV
jgi:hypothetical protein